MMLSELTPRDWRRITLLHRLASEKPWAKRLRARRERIGRRS